MATLEQASLTESERRVLDRFVELLMEHLGEDLRSVWLYGSRARGERPHEESDVDLLVVSSRELPDDDLRVIQLVTEAAEAEGANPVFLSAKLYSPERLAQRREIREAAEYEAGQVSPGQAETIVEQAAGFASAVEEILRT
jgi:predicted nucleotidyltransferase